MSSLPDKGEKLEDQMDSLEKELHVLNNRIVQQNRKGEYVVQSKSESTVGKKQESKHIEETMVKSKNENNLPHANVDDMRSENSSTESCSTAFIDLTDDSATDSFEKIAAKSKGITPVMSKPVSTLSSNSVNLQQWRDSSGLQTDSHYLDSQKSQLQQDIVMRNHCLEKLKKQKVIFYCSLYL